MSRQTAPDVFDRVERMFRDAGASEADLEWADDAASELVVEDVKQPYIETVLGVAAQTVQDSGEPADVLFGDPEDWAHEQIAWLKAEGLDALDPPRGPLSLRVAVLSCLWLAAWIGFCLFVVALLNLLPGRTRLGFTPMMAALPLLLALVCVLANSTYTAVRPRVSFTLAITCAAGVGLVAAFALGWLIFVVHDPGPDFSGLWTFLLVPVYGLLAWGVGRLWPTRPETERDPWTGPEGLEVDTDAWAQRLRTALRYRNDVSEAGIDAVVAEVRSHLAESSASASSEFGSPEGYANTVAPEAVIKPRRKTLWWSALFSLVLIALLAEIMETGRLLSWPILAYAVVAACVGWSAADEARAWRTAVRDRSQQAG